MSFFKKLGETALNTANSIGAKSADLVEMGKLKLAKSQLEGKIKDSKTDIGHLVYEAYKNGLEPDSAALQAKFSEISDMESQIKGIDEKLDQDKEKAPVQQASTPSQQASTPPPQPASPGSSKFCSNCGTALGADAVFCNNCGTRM